MRPILFLDVSRLARRYVNFGGPTGLDRVEHAAARWLGEQDAFEARPVIHDRRSLKMLSDRAMATLLRTLQARWWSDAPRQFTGPPLAGGPLAELPGRALRRCRLLVGARPLSAAGRANVTLSMGHEGLDVAARFARLPGPFAVALHDIIPLTHPQYDHRRSSALHALRVATVMAHADHLFTGSTSVIADLISREGPLPFETSILRNGPGLPAPQRATRFERPTFVFLSSLGRRKNLCLLLEVWRVLARRPDPPHLLVVGNPLNDDPAQDLISRAPELSGLVTQTGSLGDRQVAAHLAGARAMLSPSFAEGYGLPIVEAHALGVPVVASDIPAHRDVGGHSALYLSPVDGLGWLRAIEAFTHDEAFAARQRGSIPEPPSWSAYFATLTRTLTALARRTPCSR